jgi:hypothetical protein
MGNTASGRGNPYLSSRIQRRWLQDESFVKERMALLEAYVDKVAHHPVLSQARLFCWLT